MIGPMISVPPSKEPEDTPLAVITCPQCGCQVGDREAHGQWHRRVAEAATSALTWRRALDAAMDDIRGG